ncbi:sialate O-acetylesterase [Flavicella marina]|uniref:sialate O-acetylesterase n=1 Tax=Flavicella marina TaxID=1475951 RepID=UPI001264288F|nr:sialate O-acetylesterase [Flavicella marina]
MYRLIKVFGVAVFLALVACKGTQKVVSEKKNLTQKVFFFAGQSNMEGRADADKISSEDFQRLEAVKNRIQFYYNDQKVSPLKITLGNSYVQKKFKVTHVFGPEIFFGIELAEAYPEEEFIFIKRSQGGTSLYGAWNPYWTEEKAALTNELKTPKLYSEFISLAHLVLDPLKKSDYQICGMLWVQGEADSNTKRGMQPSESYGQNLSNLIHSVRDEFGVPEMPFMMFQVGNGKVVEGMKKVSKEDVLVGLIPQSNNKNSKDFYPKNPPPIGHYVTKSMKRIGAEFYKLYQAEFAKEYFVKE